MNKGVEDCPICGGACEHRQCGRSVDGVTFRSYIQCIECDLRSPLFDTKKQAIEYWNSRIQEARTNNLPCSVCVVGKGRE